MTDHVHENTANGTVTEPEPVSVPFDQVINRVSRHYADENSRLVTQLALSQEENSALRAIVAELRAGVRDA